MKQKKIFTIIASAVLAVSGAAGVTFLQMPTAQAAKKSAQAGYKYGLGKRYSLPKKIRGTWYNQNAAYSPLTITKNKFSSPQNPVKYAYIYVVGKVKGTNKYPWQLAGKFKKHYTHAMRIKKARTMNQIKWTIIAPVANHARKMNTAYASHTETVAGKKVQVLFEADYAGRVVRQYFSTKDLAEQYGSENFADMTYAKNFVGTQA